VEEDLKTLGRKTATTCSGCRRSQRCTSRCAAATRPWSFGQELDRGWCPKGQICQSMGWQL